MVRCAGRVCSGVGYDVVLGFVLLPPNGRQNMGCGRFSVGALFSFLALPWAALVRPPSVLGWCRVFAGYVAVWRVVPCEVFSMGLITGVGFCGLLWASVFQPIVAVFFFFRGCNVSVPCWMTASGVSDSV